MISTGQVSAGTAPATLCVIPPGLASVVVSNAGTVTAYVAAGGTASSTNGIPVASGQALPVIGGYQTSLGVALSVVTAGGTAAVGFALSTPGQAGP